MKSNVLLSLFFAVLVGLTILPSQVVAQEPLFNEALQKGINSKGFYTATTKKKDVYQYYDFQAIAEKKGYILNADDYQMRTVNRFGHIYDVVASVDFFKPEDFPKYAYCYLANAIGVNEPSVDDWKNRGLAYLYYEDKDNCCYYKDYSVHWSNELGADRRINGSGRGFFFNNEWLCCFQGSFVNGVPVGSVDFLWLKWNNTPAFFNKDGSYSLDKRGSNRIKPLKSTVEGVDPWVYTKVLKNALEKGTPPSLSEDIYGRLGVGTFARTKLIFLDGDNEMKKVRSCIEPLAKAGHEEAARVLDYLDVYDGWYLATTDTTRAKEVVLSPETFERSIRWNYWPKIKQAESRIESLKNILPENVNKLEKIEKLLDKWDKTILAYSEAAARQAELDWNAFFNEIYYPALAAAESSSSSSSSSSEVESSASNTKEIASVDIESIKMPSYEWVSDWYNDTILPSDIKNEGGENHARKIKFPGVGTGTIGRVIGYDGYWSTKKRYRTIEDAIIAEYVWKKYGEIRQTGRM